MDTHDDVPDALPPSYAASITAPLSAPSQPLQATASPLFDHQHGAQNLPSGFFLLRNRAHNRTLDMVGHRTNEGAEIGLHPVKQPQLRHDNSLQIQSNNQLWFVGWDGNLYSASASRAVDCVDNVLSLAIPHPVYEIPSRASHPLPQFYLDAHTSTLHVRFACDPSFPGPSGSNAWRETDYLVEAIPRASSTDEVSVWATATDRVATASKDLFSGLGIGDSSSVFNGIGETFGGFADKLSLFAKGPPSPPLPPPPPPSHDRPLPRPPWSTSPPSNHPPDQPQASTSRLSRQPPSPSPSFSRTYSSSRNLPPPPPDDEDYDSDTSPEAFRPIRIIPLPQSSWREKFPPELLSQRPSSSLGLPQSSKKELRKWRRRQWEVIPVVVRPKADVEARSPVVATAGSRTVRPPELSLSPERRQLSDEWGRNASRWATSASNLATSAGALVSGSLRSPLLNGGEQRRRRRSEEEDQDDDSTTLFDGDRDEGARELESWPDATVLPSAEIAEFGERNRVQAAGGSGKNDTVGDISDVHPVGSMVTPPTQPSVAAPAPTLSTKQQLSSLPSPPSAAPVTDDPTPSATSTEPLDSALSNEENKASDEALKEGKGKEKAVELA